MVPLTGVIDEIEPAAVKVAVSVKSPASTPLTFSLKITRNIKVVALTVWALGFCRLIELTDGAVVSTSTALVLGGVKLRPAAFPAVSLIVPPFKPIGEADAIPSVSVSPASTVYRNTRVLEPLPDK